MSDHPECLLYARVQDEQSGRMVYELVKAVPGAHGPAAALQLFFDEDSPPAGTYYAENHLGRTATARYEPKVEA